MPVHRRKVCKECGAEKSIRHFYRAASNADGRMTKCSDCHRRYVEANQALKAEQYKATKAAWAAKPENREKRRAYANSERGKEIMKESRKTWRILNAEHYRQTQQKWWRIQNERRRLKRQAAREARNQPPPAGDLYGNQDR